MSAFEQIQLFQTLFYVSLGVAVLGLILAVFFFFFFDIRSVYTLLFEKGKADTIRKMAEQNAKTGTLRRYHTGNTGNTGNTGSTGNPDTLPLTKDSASAPQAQTEAAETVVLQPDAAETSVLAAASEATTVLQPAVEAAPRKTPEVKSGIRFEVTENTILIHTDEFI